MKYYAGIGSRKTPYEIISVMVDIGKYLAKMGYILRSGAADGADAAFEAGCDSVSGSKLIYLPWKGFNRSDSEFYTISEEAFELAKKYHPNWTMLRHSAEKLHARNCYQILGEDLKTPSKFVVCWSNGSGGTEQALRIATAYNIPIINLYDPEQLKLHMEIINTVM